MTMTYTTTEPMPDAGTDIEMMTLPEVQTELQRYKPGHRSEVIAIEAYMARRAKLWRRLDELPARSAAATPPQRGAQQA
jgi:hypothetical protein